MIADARQLVDPAFFSRLESIELRARGIVEGLKAVPMEEHKR